MPFSKLDRAGIGRALAQIAERPSDLIDAFFERREEVELPPDDEAPGLRVCREDGLAVRLIRDERTWLAGRDQISPDIFQDALRRAARAVPRASYPRPEMSLESWGGPAEAQEVLEFPSMLRAALRDHHLDLPLRLRLRRHRRWVLIIGTQLTSGIEEESFYSYQAEIPGGRLGALTNALDDRLAAALARSLSHLHQAREAAPPEPWNGPVILGPSAVAVLLHEAVAHTLEADTLALGGHPEAAIGVQLGGESLHVFDDPTQAPEGVARTVDDEGFPAAKRCLLRGGVVQQPLCDRAWARRSERLAAGAGRRSDRHSVPTPRSHHLELGTGEMSRQDLFAGADGGLFLPEVERGYLDPMTGRLHLRFLPGRRIQGGVPADPVGPCHLDAHVSEVLGAIHGIGSEARQGGAGWCAKGGVKLAVWATAPEVRLEGLEIGP